MATKADKLIARASETPEVAAAAGCVAEMLIRMMLNQPSLFAGCVERALPGLTPGESGRLAEHFGGVAEYFREKAAGNDPPQPGRPGNGPVREWRLGGGEYKIVRVFAVLACPFDYCPDNPGCWETRRELCGTDGRRFRQGSGERERI